MNVARLSETTSSGVRRIDICVDSDVFAARRCAAEVGRAQGLSEPEIASLVTAVSEIARNIIVHARRGELRISPIESSDRRGVLVIAEDDGPGIINLRDAMRDGHSTGKGLGLGLPSAQRLVDEFEIDSSPGSGTTVTLRKWAGSAEP